MNKIWNARADLSGYRPKVTALSGSWQSPSKTRALTDAAAEAIKKQYPCDITKIDLAEVGTEIAALKSIKAGTPDVQSLFLAVAQSDLLIVGSPVFKASYTGLFKHFFDLLDPSALAGTPILLTATGGSHHHALVLEHHFRPLFGFFRAQTLPTAVYAVESDFENGVLVSEGIKDRLGRAIDEAVNILSLRQRAWSGHDGLPLSRKEQ
jgi:FMN reductase